MTETLPFDTPLALKGCMGCTHEFELVLRCCRLAFTGAELERIPEPQLDWALFHRIARFHRVQGLVWTALSRIAIPEQVRDALSRDARFIAAHNVRAAADSKVLLERFRSAGVEPLFVKGLTLGTLAYGDIAIKSAVDIDILVSPTALEKSADLLREDGYRLEEPQGPFSVDRLRAWHRPGKESTWVRRDPWSVVDLHTRLADNPRLIPSIGLKSPRQFVEVSGGIALPTLQDDELFAYLCVHGASSAWFRLKWITDLAALLHRADRGDIARLYERSQELGAGRAADQALLLADRLYATLEGGDDLRKRLLSDSRSRWLCAAAWQQLAGHREPQEPTGRPLGTATIHLTQFFLVPGVRFKLSELVRQARAALR